MNSFFRKLGYLLNLSVVVLCCSQSLYAEDTVVLRSVIKGNQEQPKVLNIVPWQEPDGPDNLYSPLYTLVNDVFAPIERDDFVRELQYRERMNANAVESVVETRE